MISLKDLKAKAEAANAISTNWHVTNHDMFVAAEKVPKEHDWYWITGEMYDHEVPLNNDEAYRGPKQVVQTHCRFIAAANPEIVLKLCEALEKAKQALIDISKQGYGLQGLLEDSAPQSEIADYWALETSMRIQKAHVTIKELRKVIE